MKKILMLVSALALVAPCALAQKSVLGGSPNQTPHETISGETLHQLQNALQRAVEQSQTKSKKRSRADKNIQIPQELVIYRDYIKKTKVYNHDTRGSIVLYAGNVESAMEGATPEQMELYMSYLNPVEEVVDGKKISGIRSGWGQIFNYPNDVYAAEEQYRKERFKQDDAFQAPAVNSMLARTILRAIEFLRTCPADLVPRACQSIDDLFEDYHSTLSEEERAALGKYYYEVSEARDREIESEAK